MIRRASVSALLGVALLGASLGAVDVRALELALTYRDAEGRFGELELDWTPAPDGFDMVVVGRSGASAPARPVSYSVRGEQRVLHGSADRRMAPHHLRELVGTTPLRLLDLEKIDAWLRDNGAVGSREEKEVETVSGEEAPTPERKLAGVILVPCERGSALGSCLADGSAGLRREVAPGPEKGGAWWEVRLKSPKPNSR